jgi:hypothetical protein
MDVDEQLFGSKEKSISMTLMEGKTNSTEFLPFDDEFQFKFYKSLPNLKRFAEKDGS